MKWLSFVAVGLMLYPTCSRGQVPSVSAVQPAAVVPGEAVDLTITGGNLAGAPQLWTRFPSKVELTPGIDKNGQEAGKVVFRVTVPPEVSAGVYGIRVGTSLGVSPIRLLMVDDLKSVVRDAANLAPEKAQLLTLPIAVDGRVDALQKNYFKFQVTAGQRVAFEVVARRFGSALDPMIRLLNSEGRELSYADDSPGLSGDCQLSHVFEQAGEYQIEVRDIRYQGGGNFHYRLRVGDFPLITVPVPQAVQRGTTSEIGFAGLDVQATKPVSIAIAAESQDDWVQVSSRREGGNASGFATLAVSDSPEFLESEPNNTADQGNPVELGTNLNGKLMEAADQDFFKFKATKGQKLIFETWTRRQGSPADVMLEMWKVGGGKLAEADDNGTLDGKLVFTVPADGEFALGVRDLHRRGGSAFGYRVVASVSKPDFQLACSADRLNIPIGGTAQVTVTVARHDFAGPIHLSCPGLPEGLESVPTTIGPGRNSVVLTLSSKSGIAGGQMTPVQIVGKAQIGDREIVHAASVSAALQAASNAMPWPAYVLDQASAVGITAALPYRLRTEPAEVVLGRNLKTSFKVIVERNEGFDEQVELKLLPEKDGVPAGIGVAAKPIPKGQNEVVIEINANDKAPMGQFTAVLNSTLKKDKSTFSQPVPGISFQVAEPLKVSTLKAVEVAKGQKLSLTVTIERNPSLSGPVDVTLQNLPAGVTAAPLQIPADKSDGVVELSATADAAAANVANVIAQAQVAVGDKKFQGQSPQLTLVVK